MDQLFKANKYKFQDKQAIKRQQQRKGRIVLKHISEAFPFHNQQVKEELEVLLKPQTSDLSSPQETIQVQPRQYSQVRAPKNQRSVSLRQQKEEVSLVHRARLDLNNSFSQNYNKDEVLKTRDKIPLSAFIYQGFEIVDYTQSINALHKQLLKKIILNK